MTQFEKIKAMSIKEMATFMLNHADCSACAYNNTECISPCTQGYKEWLESEVTEQ